MKLKVTEHGITVPKTLLEGIEEVEVRWEEDWIVIVPIQLSAKPRTLELHTNSIQITGDFDQPLSDEFWLGNS